MAKTEATRLNVNARETTGSRSMRRLRREGRVPGVLYGGTGDPVPFDVDARELRHALHAAGAVLEVAIGSDTDTAVVKDTQRHPVRGETMHLDLVRVRMDVAIQATAVLELEGVEEAPGVVEGGVLEQVTREVTVEALPGDIPESIKHDASKLEPGATLFLSEVTAPPNVTIVDDPETVVATIIVPRLEVETTDEIETETEVVGEGEAEGDAEGADEATADEGADAAASDADTTSE